MIQSMVSHDFARGTIRGLPPSVVSAARKTGKLPEGALPALMVDSWNAVRAQQKNAFVGLTVADVQRQRWGFETEGERREAWEVFAGKGGGPAMGGPPGTVVAQAGTPGVVRPGGQQESVSDWWCNCHNDTRTGAQVGDRCGDNDVGKITDVSRWALDGEMCVKGTTCKNLIGCPYWPAKVGSRCSGTSPSWVCS